MQNHLPRVNPSLLVIITEGFSSRLSFGLISFALPLYAHHLGLSLAEIGVLVSLNLTVALLLKPAMGWVADRLGLKQSLTAAIGLRSVIALLLAFAGSPWQLFAIRAGHGISIAARDPAVNALLAEHGGKRAVASAFAWYQTAKSVAGALGKALAGVLLTLTASNFSLLFVLAFLLSALPLYIVARFIQEKNNEEHKPSAAPHADEEATSTAPEKRPAILPFAGLGFLISGTAEMLHGLFPILATEYAGLNAAEAGVIYLISTLIILVSGPFFGWLSDNVSRKFVLLVRGSANALSSLVYLVAPNFAGMATAKFVDEVGKSAFRPAWGALMADISSFDKRRRARTMSVMSMGEDAGEIAGPILAGFLWNTWGIVAMLGGRILLAVLAEIYAVVLTGSRKKRSPRATK